MLKVGLPKGVVIQKSFDFLEHFLKEEVDRRKLYFQKNDMSFYLLKHRDIPALVYNRKLDLGITSSEWLIEYNFPLCIARELNWCDTHISLLSAFNKPILQKNEGKISCVTEFPNIATGFFQSAGIKAFEIEHLSGSTEGLVPTLYDCSIDCVETGFTAELHNLRVEHIIYQSKTVVVVREQDRQKWQTVINSIATTGGEV
jgi:ATP phosphoribosyltransferase